MSSVLPAVALLNYKICLSTEFRPKPAFFANFLWEAVTVYKAWALGMGCRGEQQRSCDGRGGRSATLCVLISLKRRVRKAPGRVADPKLTSLVILSLKDPKL